ncbi:MAG TPA: amidohydrolase [Acidobacteriota bacterium]|nr:amidohydrolase [Acidobacteriota bacterium]
MKPIAIFASLLFLVAGVALSLETVPRQEDGLHRQIDQRVEAVEDQVVAWRRDFHRHPELSNREFRTASKVADHLRSLGMEVQTEVAHTGVVGLLRGGRPGPVVALRADMDGLPVTEATGLEFASTQRATYNGQEVGVMHACGHDSHVAILMGAAQVLASLRDQLPGTVKFIFQPAEEGAPRGEEGGAELMVKEGVMENPVPGAVFGLHISSTMPVNTVNYRPGGLMASADVLRIKVKGKQTHGASPFLGIDPIVVSAQIIMGLQTIVSRQTDITQAPAIVTIGMIRGGVRSNIIPNQVEMEGTIRALDTDMQKDIHERIRRTANSIAESAGAEAEVEIDIGYPVTHNDERLTEAVLPTVYRVAGQEQVIVVPPITGAEDFSFYAQEVPGFFFFLGAKPPHLQEPTAHHTPEFLIDEDSFDLGVRLLVNLTVDYLNGEIQR